MGLSSVRRLFAGEGPALEDSSSSSSSSDSEPSSDGTSSHTLALNNLKRFGSPGEVSRMASWTSEALPFLSAIAPMTTL